MTNSQRAGALVSLVAGGMFAARAWRSLRAIDFADKTVLIFGGSRGLGLIIARELAAEGARLVIVANDADDLSATGMPRVEKAAHVLVIFQEGIDLINQQRRPDLLYDTEERGCGYVLGG